MRICIYAQAYMHMRATFLWPRFRSHEYAHEHTCSFDHGVCITRTQESAACYFSTLLLFLCCPIRTHSGSFLVLSLTHCCSFLVFLLTQYCSFLALSLMRCLSFSGMMTLACKTDITSQTCLFPCENIHTYTRIHE